MNTSGIYLPIIITIMAFLLIAFSVTLAIFKYKSKKSETEIDKSKLSQSEVIIYAAFAIIFLLFISGAIVQAINSEFNFLMNISVTIIITWIVLLICYYVWALYFYNINLGWSEDKWNRHLKQQKENPNYAEDAPDSNPYSDETLGLPPGTVRGTIALSLLVGALALTIASFSMSTSIKSNTTLVDNFEFYKKAFLMMIAFYFGTKSLQILQKSSDSDSSTDIQQSPNNTSTSIDQKNSISSIQKDFHNPEAQG